MCNVPCEPHMHAFDVAPDRQTDTLRRQTVLYELLINLSHVNTEFQYIV